PPAVVADFRDIHSKTLTEYKSAQSALQKAVETNDLFLSTSSNGAIPSLISNHLKLPKYQLVKSAAGVDNDPRVVAALGAATKDHTAVLASATAYLGTVYAVQVEHCRNQINAQATAERFAAKLKSYSELIIGSAGSDDLGRWAPCISMLEHAFLTELEDLNFDKVARVQKAAIAKEAKATAVAVARADAEMEVDTAPVVGTIKDEKAGEAQAGYEEGPRRKRRKRHRKEREGRRREEEVGQEEAAAVVGQRLGVADSSPPSLAVSRWVRPSGTRFHHHRPDTYPDMFFADTTTDAARTRYVISQMSPLYYDTRIRNRAFHNLTDVVLSPEQTLLLALNPKF
ncbi:hypothetical protein DFH09DRAFT_873707, partial [Mycena vulgaris]